ncbi:peptide-methionine (R)-S-oxide reductase [Candidatus Kaiserbacteria bacterium]|nr:MAG: peptide-methionine (R)-S-oxide reductase [Candidatus Kaiserbacteria bacterium]
MKGTFLEENPELDRISKGGTEAPYSGKYVDTKDSGMYHCAVCGSELFSSEKKLDSGKSSPGLQGWPSFTEPEDKENVILRPDGNRTEVLCKKCEAHLGHVFKDIEEDGKTCDHYCINSISLDLKN